VTEIKLNIYADRRQCKTVLFLSEPECVKMPVQHVLRTGEPEHPDVVMPRDRIDPGAV